MKELKIKITLTEEMLGMAASDPNIHEKYIASQAPDAPSVAQEVEALGVEEVVEGQMTVFPRNSEGQPIMWDYQMKGFFKDVVGMLRRVPGSECSKIKAYKKEIDGLLFVQPRQIPIQMSGNFGNCQRSLRTSGPSGERVALANSETVPAGSTIEMKVVMLVDTMEKWVTECLDYGTMRGLGQWRNSGKGTFTYEVIE